CALRRPPTAGGRRHARGDLGSREVARYRLDEAQAGVLPQAFVTAEEERLVADDRAADGSAELIEAQRLLDVVILVGRIECVVAVILEQRSVEPVGPALGDDGDVATCAEATLRG